MRRSALAQRPVHIPDLDGLLCALVLAPGSYSRNRFYPLFTDAQASQVRQRAARLSGIVRHLAARAEPSAIVMEERELPGGQWLLRYRMPVLGVERTAILEPLEEATVRYALDRAGKGSLLPLSDEQRGLVESTLRKLGEGLDSSDRRDD